MLTTNDILKLFNQKIDKTYTGYFDNYKLNRWFYEALLEGVENKYLKLDQQKIYDELRWLVSTEQPFNAFDNQVFLQPMLITSISYTAFVIGKDEVSEAEREIFIKPLI